MKIITRKNANFCNVLLIIILVLSSTFYIIASGKIYSSSVVAGDVNERNFINFGDSISFKFNHTHDEYIAFKMSDNSTFELTFLNGDTSNKIVVNSGIWATIKDGASKPILHLVPSYIQKDGYNQIIVTPIRGESGEYYIEHFETLTTDDIDNYKKYNTIDFEIKQYEIMIDESDYQVILQDRKDGLELGILHTDDESVVSAKIKADGENYSTDIRLKGDWTDHLVGDQWSYRVELSGDYCIYGLQKFSLQPVATRNGIWEYLIYEMYRDSGGVALRYDFADVYVNGVYLGVFAVEEFMEKRVVENSLNREGPIIKYNETQMWERWSFYNKLTAPIRDYQVFSQNKTTQSETLDGYASYAITLMNKFLYEDEPVENVFDVEKYIKLYTILDLFSSYHGRAEHNMRHYYNPVTAKLEPIPFDEGSNVGNLDLINNTDIYSAEQFLIYDILTSNTEYQELASDLLIEYAKNYNDFVKHYETQVNNFIKTIQRDDITFTMDIMAVQPKVDEILSLNEVLSLEITLYQDGDDYILNILNPNTSGVKVSSELCGNIEIGKYQTFTLHLDDKITELDIIYQTSYSDIIDETLDVEFLVLEKIEQESEDD